MSAVGQKQTFAIRKGMSALPSKADICSQRDCKNELWPSLVPPSSAVPTAADKQQYDDDDQKSCGVHIFSSLKVKN
jgi:hypothetical protein